MLVRMVPSGNKSYPALILTLDLANVTLPSNGGRGGVRHANVIKVLECNQNSPRTQLFYPEKPENESNAAVSVVSLAYFHARAARGARIFVYGGPEGQCAVQVQKCAMAINYKIHPLSAANLLELLLSLAIIQTIACADKQIRFSVILSFGEYGYNSSGAVPSLDLALERVAAMQVLPGYRLHYDTVWDSKVSLINIRIFFSQKAHDISTVSLNLSTRRRCSLLSRKREATEGVLSNKLSVRSYSDLSAVYCTVVVEPSSPGAAVTLTYRLVDFLNAGHAVFNL